MRMAVSSLTGCLIYTSVWLRLGGQAVDLRGGPRLLHEMCDNASNINNLCLTSFVAKFGSETRIGWQASN